MYSLYTKQVSFVIDTQVHLEKGLTARQNPQFESSPPSVIRHDSGVCDYLNHHTMHLLTVLGPLWLLFTCGLADVSTDLFYWPLGASQPSSLARVTYDPTTLSSKVVSYHSPNREEHDSLARVGFYTSTSTNPKQWIGSLVSSSSLTDESSRPTFRLHLGPANEVYHVSLAPTSETMAEGQSPLPRVELVSNTAGPQPHLNRPVVVGPDGQNTEEVVEKSFLQK